MDLAERVMILANQVAVESEPQLTAIVDEAGERHGLSKVECRGYDAIRIGAIINEVQMESFRLGLKTAIALVMQVANEANANSPGSSE